MYVCAPFEYEAALRGFSFFRQHLAPIRRPFSMSTQTQMPALVMERGMVSFYLSYVRYLRMPMVVPIGPERGEQHPHFEG